MLHASPRYNRVWESDLHVSPESDSTDRSLSGRYKKEAKEFLYDPAKERQAEAYVRWMYSQAAGEADVGNLDAIIVDGIFSEVWELVEIIEVADRYGFSSSVVTMTSGLFEGDTAQCAERSLRSEHLSELDLQRIKKRWEKI